jgi:hypothetical protein
MKEPIQISSTSFIKEDIFLSVLILALFVMLCDYLYTIIMVHNYGVAFKPKIYLINFFAN